MAGERVTLHNYRDEVLVEVIVDEGGGDVRTVSMEFDVDGTDDRALVPRGPLPEDYAEDIRRRIEDSAYTLERTRHAAGQ